MTGLPLGGVLDVPGLPRGDVDIALLDPAGNRLIIPSAELVANGNIRGTILDTSGATPTFLPDFLISNTPADIANVNPAVAADTATGTSMVVWENISGVQGDPVNIRGRRFDADGNPVGGDFLVNTTTAESQGQPAVAYGSGGESVVVWAGDGQNPPEDLDVFFQVYDAMGNPIDVETRANTVTDDIQDRPAVRFLPEPDAQGRPQFVVMWRDVGNADGSNPRGTGQSYRCFSIGDPPGPEIFADGFESGDTTSWSNVQQPPAAAGGG